MIKRDPQLVFSKDEDGFTPLHLAAASGNKEIVEVLLAANADVNSKDNAGSTPLHQASTARGQHRDLFDLLSARDANVNAVDKHGLTSLHYATLADNPDAVIWLLNHGANANCRDTEAGESPLILAAAQGHKEVVELLLAHGADVNLADNRGTPLAWAIHTRHANIAGLLRQHGGHE